MLLICEVYITKTSHVTVANLQQYSKIQIEKPIDFYQGNQGNANIHADLPRHP